jgi:hypothetical protein
MAIGARRALAAARAAGSRRGASPAASGAATMLAVPGRSSAWRA